MFKKHVSISNKIDDIINMQLLDESDDLNFFRKQHLNIRCASIYFSYFFDKNELILCIKVDL